MSCPDELECTCNAEETEITPEYDEPHPTYREVEQSLRETREILQRNHYGQVDFTTE